jgi:hypothetical protein
MELKIGEYYTVSKDIENKFMLFAFSKSRKNAFLSFNGKDMDDGGVVINVNKLLKLNK